MIQGHGWGGPSLGQVPLLRQGSSVVEGSCESMHMPGHEIPRVKKMNNNKRQSRYLQKVLLIDANRMQTTR